MKAKSANVIEPYVELAVSLVLAYTVSAIGGVATSLSVHSWYPTLLKPVWTPPPWVFGPVWLLLYTMMAVAAWLIWLRKGRRVRTALTCYGVQLLLNALWPILFFGCRMPGAAAWEIIALWVAIVGTWIAFLRVRPLAAWLLVPYVAWTTFAGALNWAIWLANSKI